MEKLELKHLAGYLPYDLRYKFANQTYIFRNVIDFDYEYSKPILHPLSDLTKEIEVNGEKFVPMEELVRIMHPNEVFISLETSTARNLQSVRYKYHRGRNTVCDTINVYTEELNQGSKYCFNIVNTDWWIIQKLLEWHFDIHGLIEKGLAIDINTL